MMRSVQIRVSDYLSCEREERNMNRAYESCMKVRVSQRLNQIYPVARAAALAV